MSPFILPFTQNAEKVRQLRSRIVQTLNVKTSLSEVGRTVWFFRSPRSILGANGPHEVRYVPPRAFTRCGLAWDKARLGAPGLGG
jgi:hypothetical protein